MLGHAIGFVGNQTQPNFGNLVQRYAFLARYERNIRSMAEIDHVAYFRARTAAERELARTAPQPYIANIHSQMAERYDALCDHPQHRNVLHLVTEAPRPLTA